MVSLLFPTAIWLRRFARPFWELGPNPAQPFACGAAFTPKQQGSVEVSSPASLLYCETGSLQQRRQKQHKSLAHKWRHWQAGEVLSKIGHDI